MNPFLMSLPTVAIGFVVLFFAVRTIRLVDRIDAASKAGFERRMAERNRLKQEREALGIVPGRPTVLRLTLDLVDPTPVIDVLRVAHAAERMISGLSAYETTLGGRGLVLTEAKAAVGQVILTLTPQDATDAVARVERVAEALNAAFDPAAPKEAPPPDLGSLPGDVSGAHAVALAA